MDRFWTQLYEMVDSIPREERVVVAVDLNGHVGEENRGHGQDFAKRMEMPVVNTFFQKREEHRVTYSTKVEVGADR